VAMRKDTLENWVRIGAAFDATEVGHGGHFQLSDIERGPDPPPSLRHYASVTDVAKVASETSQSIPTPDGVVIDRTGYELETDSYEVFSSHRLCDGRDRAVVFKRRQTWRAQTYTRFECLERALAATPDLGRGLPDGRTVPLLATKPEVAEVLSMRREQARAGNAYAMRLDPEYMIRCADSDLDTSDDALDSADCVGDIFDIRSPDRDRQKPHVLVVRDVFAGVSGRLSEYLVELPGASGSTYFISRDGLRPGTPQPDRRGRAIALAQRAGTLPARPLGNGYRAQLFHHPDCESYDRILAIVAYSRAVRNA
jgi:hypothetical protein